MGKLKPLSVLNSLVSWGIPVVIVGCLLFVVNARISANPEPSRSELEEYLKTNSLQAGVESTNGYQQIFYIFNGVKIYVTNDSRNHTHPVVSGRYVAWSEVIEGFPQIVLYDFLDKTRLQITQTGTNISPAIWENKVVWEGLSSDKQQIFYFDGIDLNQISDSEYTSLRPVIKGNTILYAQHTPEAVNPWRVISHVTDAPVGSNPDTIIKEGSEVDSWPSFVGDIVKTTL